ncbi:MAG: VRR-NUC domain-containing protein [Proteobacteria bacterium]|nr:VRR-NUC domain-containing protein [Pseudomonadota bacterium]
MQLKEQKRREQDLQKAILHYLAAMGFAAWRQNNCAASTGSRLVRFGVPGTSDIIGILPAGKFLAVKVKAEKGQLTQRQNIFIGEVMKNNGVAIAVQSVDDVVSGVEKYLSMRRISH